MTTESTSLLAGLPSELQALIFDNLTHIDLNKLCLTCKTINAVALPQLYKKVNIKVPQKWSRLPSFEGLLSSAGAGLGYTRELFIEAQQDPLRDGQHEDEESLPKAQLLERTKLHFYLPKSSSSNGLNALVRLLILKLSQNRLEFFCWSHLCELDVSTLDILVERQASSLRWLSCQRYSPSCDRYESLIKGLGYLNVSSMDLERGSGQWAASLMVANADTLTHLSLGFTARIAHDLALKRRPRYDKMSKSFAAHMKDCLSKRNMYQQMHLSLDSLDLCGLDIGAVVRGDSALHINFNNITQLKLESCPGLVEAFPLLTGQGNSSRLALGAIKDLHVREEDPDSRFKSRLKSFLTSIRGLIHLTILIDNVTTGMKLDPILKVHGKTLETLFWDEREKPRIHLNRSTCVVPGRIGNLEVISQNCPSLTSLGIPFNWEVIHGSEQDYEWIGECLEMMPCLEALNIRNLPELTGRTTFPIDYFVKGLASRFVDIINKEQKPTLTTVALGAPLYSDIHIGTYHIVHTRASDFLRFRMYHVDYSYRSSVSVSPVLSEVIKGAASTCEESLYPKHFLDKYWLV